MSILLAVAWLGVFRPAQKVDASLTKDVVGRAGEVVVLTPGDGAAPTGDITIVQPLVGMNIAATISASKIPLVFFGIDRREGADTVLLLPGKTVVRFIEPTPADVKSIRAALLRNEVLSGVKRSVAQLEVGAVDIDGDGKADYAITYGCNAWADGDCQSHGEFVLARTGAVWKEIQ